MTITIAIWAMVVASRASQKALKSAILSGSGRRLTQPRLAGWFGRGNARRLIDPAIDPQATN